MTQKEMVRRIFSKYGRKQNGLTYGELQRLVSRDFGTEVPFPSLRRIVWRDILTLDRITPKSAVVALPRTGPFALFRTVPA